MTHARIAMVGFGNVGRSTAELLMDKRAELLERYGLTWSVTGIATGRHGIAVNPDGIDLDRALALVSDGQRLDSLSTVANIPDTYRFVQTVPADVLFENSPVNHETGRPAVDYIRTALERGLHAITANKGPVAHAERELSLLATQRGRRFLYESAVMDATPIFSLFRQTLPASRVERIHGILNATTNLILEMMSQGHSFEDSVAHCQQIGVAETDPSGDIDGWDAALKLSILTSVIMGVVVKPQDIERTGIRAISAAMLAEARECGERWKLVCSAERACESVRARVAPERVKADSILYNVSAGATYVNFDLDTMTGLGIYQGDSEKETTAYGLLCDLIEAFCRS